MSEPNEQNLLLAQLDDLRAERNELDTVLGTLRPDDWDRVTGFKNWRVWDVVAHLHLSDHMGMESLAGETRFQALMGDMRDAGVPMADYARHWLGDVTGPELHRRWHDLLGHLCDGLAATAPDTRLPWAGPSMKPRMFATARQMETWAHGWEIYDLLGMPRHHTDRLRNVATIGVRTFGWTFINRKLEIPGSPPCVELRAPSGAIWRWHEDNTRDCVRGDAVAFCQVVTQVRHVSDTDLVVEGPVAQRWMAIAQCFAGPPADPPAPGSRVPPQRL